jgi:tRNA dimethylallyltransferase
VTTLLCLVGPTAGGKSRMGVEVAQALRGRGHAPEIVSCDSMGVYRQLDIVADKPTDEERGGIPHHLFDLIDPDESFTASKFKEIARATIADITERGGMPMLVGGSGLYFRSVVDELTFAPTSPEVRERLTAEDPAVLLERLRDADPATADRLDPRNPRRIVRAAEILEVTGRPPSVFRGSWERFEGPYELVVAGLTWDRSVLLERAAERVDREIAKGLLEEVAKVKTFSRSAAQALGVKEMIPVTEGLETLETARTLLVRNTKTFVRRQISWFKRDPRVVWVDASELGWEGARNRILELFLSGLGERR